MKTLKTSFAAAALLGSLLLGGYPAFANDAHHPEKAAAPAPAAAPAAPGMMGGGMMGGGMMGMMGGGTMNGMGPGMMFAPDAATLEKAKTDIGITGAQETAWKAYVAAVQGSVDNASKLHQTMDPKAMHQKSPEERRTFMQDIWKSRSESLQAVGKAREELFAVLSDTQRTAAEKALGTAVPGMTDGMTVMMGHMMGMMGGVTPGAQDAGK